jgi:hypothetical protein
LEQLIKRDGFVVGRHFLFADVIDRPRVEEFIRDLSGGLSRDIGTSLWADR